MISFVIVHVTFTCNLKNTDMETQNEWADELDYINYLEPKGWE